MPARAKASILVFFAASERRETFRGATFLENDCHFAMIRIDTSVNAVAGETVLRRCSIESQVRF